MSDAPSDDALPGFVRRGLPGAGHAAMQPLVGEFDCRTLGYIATGTPENPAQIDLHTRREWIAGGRHLRDETSGGDYYRMGVLSYSNLDERFEWVTQDAINATMMIYVGEPRSGPRFPTSMPGVFTDQGVTGEQNVGTSVPMRTVITVEDDDHHTIDIFMTAPGREEILADRKIYTRRSGT